VVLAPSHSRHDSKTWRQYTRPIQLFVGRIAAEKNLEVFLRAATGGTKIIVGDGPQLAAARLNYPDAVFLGEMKGEELARCYSEADVFVFSSQLDTFGLVILEALASGVPVAALPSPHLLEIFEAHEVVAFDEDLAAAIRHALTIAPERCRQVATQFSWRACTDQFVRIIQDDRRKWSYIGSRSDRFSC
jgi:glycosyltransferase involved in cell wall biosynthesis